MRRLLLCFFAIAIFVSFALPAYAATTAPNLPLEALQNTVNDLYTYSLKIVGLCVFVMFLFAGLRYIIPDDMWSDQLRAAKPMDIIKNAVIGLVLLFSAVLILNTINPDLVGGGATGTTAGGTGNFVELAPPAQDFLQQPAQPANYVEPAAPVPDLFGQ